MGGITVLIVDDDDAIRELCVLTLGSASVRCLEAPSGERAIHLAMTSPPDVIVCDMHMHGMSGEETLKHIRKIPKMATTPVILISGYPESRALDIGLCYLLPKPFLISELLTLFRRILSKQDDANA